MTDPARNLVGFCFGYATYRAVHVLYIWEGWLCSSRYPLSVLQMFNPCCLACKFAIVVSHYTACGAERRLLVDGHIAAVRGAGCRQPGRDYPTLIGGLCELPSPVRRLLALSLLLTVDRRPHVSRAVESGLEMPFPLQGVGMLGQPLNVSGEWGCGVSPGGGDRAAGVVRWRWHWRQGSHSGMGCTRLTVPVPPTCQQHPAR
jgi:hypothetical protein